MAAFSRAQLIDRDAEIDRDASVGLDKPGDGEIVGSDDLRRPERAAGRDQFVAGRQNRRPGRGGGPRAPVWFAAAASATSRGPSRRPAGMRVSPA